jgi:hypothetical protein
LVVEGLEALIRQPEGHPDQFHIDGHEIERLLDLARDTDVPLQRLAQLEWALRPALGFGARSPILERQMAADPSFFVEVLSMAFRARHEEPRADVSEQVARNAYQLLHDWSVVPGTTEEGSLDPQALESWVDRALDLATKVDRCEIALDQIGKVLARSPQDSDGSWPACPVRSVIERIARSELDDGFRVEILNNRGVQSRGVTEGGDRERERAAHYRSLATLVDDAPRTAAVLRSVAASYEADGQHFDERVRRITEGLDL